MRHDVVNRGLSTAASMLPEETRALVVQYLDERHEPLLAELVQRLAPMVYGVCQRQLGIGADADDAFQATFLVVVRRLKDLATKTNLAGWVHGIAFRVARKARQQSRQRQHRLHTLANMSQPSIRPDGQSDLKEIIDAEVAKLPGPYREAIALCELQEKSLEQAARELGWPVGTVAGRLSRARTLLKSRLARHGFSAVAITTCLQATASAAPSSVLVERTVQSVVLATQGLATAVSPQVAVLAQTTPWWTTRTALASGFALLITLVISTLLVFQNNTPPRPIVQVAEGNARFAIDAYQKMRARQPESNLLFSPYSLSASICLLVMGTAGDTETEMLQALRMPNSTIAHQGMNELQTQLKNASTPGVSIQIANTIFVEQNLPWDQVYLQGLDQAYQAKMIPVQYRNRLATANTINQWVRQQTSNLLDQMVRTDVVDPRTCISSVNAFSLTGRWAMPFDVRKTSLASFHTAAGKRPVPMMHYSQARQAHDGNHRLLSLDYQHANGTSDITMTLVIPTGSLAGVDAELSLEKLTQWVKLSRETSTPTTLAMPRIDVCTTTRWRESLEAMGMQSCFDPERADFTRMLNDDRALRVNHKNQRTRLILDEQGCRAASIGVDENLVNDAITISTPTATIASPSAAAVVDRPFLFFIRHHPTGTILFMGAVLTPVAGRQ